MNSTDISHLSSTDVDGLIRDGAHHRRDHSSALLSAAGVPGDPAPRPPASTAEGTPAPIPDAKQGVRGSFQRPAPTFEETVREWLRGRGKESWETVQDRLRVGTAGEPRW